MRRVLAAIAVASFVGFGALSAGVGADPQAAPSAHAFAAATAVAHLAAAAVPAPPPARPPIAGFAVLVATAAFGAALQGYVTRQRRRARFVPVLASAVRLRGPPARRAAMSPAP